MAERPRIVILGGGVGAITTAVQLSQPGWEEHFTSITVYQQGWRLGGKGACGRGRDQRIEEHGLHIWFGYYENAFRMLGRCHEELDERERTGGQPRWPLAFTTMGDSFRAHTEIALSDHDGCRWKLWQADFFGDDDSVPWQRDDGGAEPTVLSYLRRSMYLAATVMWSLVRSEAALELAGRAVRPGGLGETGPGRAAGLAGRVDLPVVLRSAAEALDALPGRATDVPFVRAAIGRALGAIDTVYDALALRFEGLARASDAVRRAGYVVDLLLAVARGMIEDDLVGANSFAPIDDLEIRDWLLNHGASPASVDCALARALLYDLPFAYEGGDPLRPSCGAGTALRGLMLAFFGWRGAIMWKMNAGMGDVVFAPLYELLVKRGVDVRFFHRVEQLTAAGGRVDQIRIDVQAQISPPAPPRAYLVDGAVWPADPRTALPGLDPAIAPEAYESWYLGPEAARVSTTTLQRGAPGDDGFELVVFGLPISCVADVAPDLVNQSAAWKAAVDHLVTVPTQALQLWLNRPASKLGEAGDGVVLGGYVEPFDTWADMSQLVSRERVGGCATVAYFCNVLEDSAPPARGSASAKRWLDEQAALVHARSMRFLRRDIAGLWPRAVDPITGEFDWDALVAPEGTIGAERLDAQYWRANVEPSERYVLSVPGSSVHRIAPADTGFANLYAAGDWTACLLNSGCVEAAAISGILAANAIHVTHGDPDRAQPIIGWDP